ncbi:unnamed protein product [Angiostrongylus costaricensis]|uniref:Uncharacterized protein n=1 Tax=Angiostrongylus costaricensis TaxID=334426 RepID=A0A158PDK9_ANGCS|nr:unnamed protein product [Angiostrongylus costaricensis]
MIGMVNVPCDTPIDFYAGAPNAQISVPETMTKRRPSFRPLFISTRDKIEYAMDGRKMSNGKSEPNKLWEELFLRSFINRLEEEIQSPVESYKTLESELAKLNIKDKSLYRSTYSLVSHNRVEDTEFDELEEHLKERCLPEWMAKGRIFRNDSFFVNKEQNNSIVFAHQEYSELFYKMFNQHLLP